MGKRSWDELDAILDKALDPPAEKRSAFLDRMHLDPSERDRLEKLIAAAERDDDTLAAGGVLEGRLGEGVAALLREDRAEGAPDSIPGYRLLSRINRSSRRSGGSWARITTRRSSLWETSGRSSPGSVGPRRPRVSSSRLSSSAGAPSAPITRCAGAPSASTRGFSSPSSATPRPSDGTGRPMPSSLAPTEKTTRARGRRPRSWRSSRGDGFTRPRTRSR
jgi:hypothetical protein